MDRPRARYVEAIPIQQDQDILVLLRDPEEICPEEMIVTPAAYILMTMLDGTRTVADVQAELMRRTGQVLPQGSLASFVETLDRALLLDNDRSRERGESLRREFARRPSRPAAHAGVSYPDDPAELRATLDAFFSQAEEGDGPPTGARPAPRGLVVPHIDIRCGGRCMARGFRALRAPGAPLPRRYIVLGVAHHATPGLYTLTDKDFETPLGLARADREAIGRLKELYGGDLMEGEYAHKREHSVEFAAVFLRHLHAADEDFTVLPILCGSLHGELQGNAGRTARQRTDVGRFCDALGTLIGEMGPSACVIASVDLSHVGRKFGDPNGVDPLRAQFIRSADLRMLERVRERDAEGFFDHFRADGNARNVDAVTAVYTMLHVLGGGEAELLDYDQHLEPATESVVSFASMALY